MRVAITGGPKTGKTTLAGPDAKHTDDLIAAKGWSEISSLAALWFNQPDPNLCVEGVAVPRALRKWLQTYPTGKPVDELVILTRTHENLTREQENMGKGHDTVLREISKELKTRGV